MATTRGKLSCPVYGIASKLTLNQLPTVGDCMRLYSFVKVQLPHNTKSGDIITKVATDIEEVWIKSGIPTVSVRRVEQRIESLHQNLRQIMKKKGESKLSAISVTKEESLALFDIAVCHCDEFNECNCPRQSKVPVLEREFLIDQRTARKMIIGSLDKATTSTIRKRTERASKLQKYYVSLSGGECHDRESNLEMDSNMDVDDVSEPEGHDSCNPSSDSDLSSDHRSKRNLMKFPTVARECDRYGISNAAGAAIATAALTDYGIIKENDTTAVIDRAKLRRQREQLRKTLSQEARSSMAANGPLSLFFDGRKDNTICMSSVNPKGVIKEEHITLIEEPHSVFIGHVTPASGTSKDIKTVIVDFFQENGISMDSINSVGADGTNVNTGLHGGVIRLLELHTGHPVQWLICMFHCNELPLRHLLLHLDGTTAGPKAFSGNLGKALETCHELPVVNFKSRQNKLPEVLQDVTDMDISKDQKYLFDIVKAVGAGHVSENLTKREPGTMCHSRWLTTANRVLRLYVSSESPSRELVLLTEYILRVYAPVWFSIKLQPGCYMGARHLWQMIHLARFLPDDVRPVVDDCIQRNAFFGHPENILLTMLVDERREIRELAARRIIVARKTQPIGIRKFKVPQLNMDADDYHNLVNWQELPRTQPPMLMGTSDSELENAIETAQKWTLDEFPCHTQSVERHVKIVTEAAGAVCGELRRDGYIRAKLLSRKNIPHYASKKDWKCESE